MIGVYMYHLEASSMVGGRCDGLLCWTAFRIRSAPDQEGVPEQDMLYRAANTVYDPFELYASDVFGVPITVSIQGKSRAQIGSMIRSLC
jgi:hypothetical protein